MSERELYSRLLLSKGHGYPLSYPQPPDDLPLESRLQGTQIGDVGILTSDGGFDAFFNICRARRDPANRFGVPSGFETIDLGAADVTSMASYHRPGSHVSNTKFRKQRLDLEAEVDNVFSPVSAGAVIELSAVSEQAAVLLLPDGASRINLRFLNIFRQQAFKHAQNWYAFLSSLGCMLENGDLYLVTGVDKSASWSVAAMESHSEDHTISLKLKAAQVGSAGASYAWQWDAAGVFADSGPRRGDPEELPSTQNQTVFLRGFKVAIHSLAGQKISQAIPLVDSKPLTLFSRRWFTSFGGRSLSLGARDISGDKTPGGVQTSSNTETEEYGSTEYYPETTRPYHPSDAINETLLASSSSSLTVAVTHDDEWAAAINKHEETIPANIDLVGRICDNYTSEYLKWRNIAKEQELALYPISSTPLDTQCCAHSFLQLGHSQLVVHVIVICILLGTFIYPALGIMGVASTCVICYFHYCNAWKPRRLKILMDNLEASMNTACVSAATVLPLSHQLPLLRVRASLAQMQLHMLSLWQTPASCKEQLHILLEIRRCEQNVAAIHQEFCAMTSDIGSSWPSCDSAQLEVFNHRALVQQFSPPLDDGKDMDGSQLQEQLLSVDTLDQAPMAALGWNLHPERQSTSQPGIAGDPKDVEAVLQTNKNTLDFTTPEDHLNRANQYPDVDVLEAALQKGVTPEVHPDNMEHPEALALSLRARSLQLGDLDDLQSPVELNRYGPDHQIVRLCNHAVALIVRHDRLDNIENLEAAIKLLQGVLTLTPVDDEKQTGYMHSLAIAFTKRFQQTRNLDDLEEGLTLNQEVVKLTSDGDLLKASRLYSLAISLNHRYSILRDLVDLEAFMERSQEAVNLTPMGDPNRASRLHRLAESFMLRYERLGHLPDLEKAVTTLQETTNLTLPDHPLWPFQLQSLARCLTYRYQMFKNLYDLQTATKLFQDIVIMTPDGHPDMPGHLKNLAISLKHRFRVLGDLNDLEALMKSSQEVVHLTPQDNPNFASRLHSLAEAFMLRFEHCGDLADLQIAIVKFQESVDLMQLEHPGRPFHLQSLASSLICRFQRLGSLDDLENVHKYYSMSFSMHTSSPEYSWRAALCWASFSKELNSENCIMGYTYAFHLLPEILWIKPVLPVQHQAIHELDIGKVTSDAVKACIEFSNLTSAVEIMEQGLEILFQQMLQLKTDLDGLLPESQVNKLQLLSLELYSGMSSDPQDATNKRQVLLSEIRKQPGLEDFLLPKRYKDLCNASQGGPIIILNSHQDRCDGIIILSPTSDPVHVSLPSLTVEMLQSRQEALRDPLHCSNAETREESAATRLFGNQEVFTLKSSEESFAELLDWLYTVVVSPVYQALENHGIHGGRLWWLPTGAFTGLPLHACAPTSQYIQSYTVTLEALLDAYSKKSSASPRIGIVGLPYTSDGSNYLPGVKQEVKKITSIIPQAQTHCLEDYQATPDAVARELQDCSWVHLACHGIQDVLTPTKSHLSLYGGKLDLDTILRMPLTNAEFVFLTACHTGISDTQLVNKSFHLGGGFIAAGFRSAIGTLWSMHDQDGPQVAETVYSHLFQRGIQPRAADTAEALQVAVQQLRTQNVAYERWVPFIHIGV